MKSRSVKFESYDGYKLEGTFIEAESEARGVVLFVHGITSDRDELGFHSDMSAFLALKGYASFRFDYRYHGINETTLENLTLSGIMNDIAAAFDTMKKLTLGKTSKYFIVATSFGGGLAAYWVAFSSKDTIRKLILNAPVLDYEDDVLRRNNLLENGHLASKAATRLKKNGYLNSSGIRFGRGLLNELKYINGINALEKLGPKAFIFHGKDDDDVPLASSKKYKSPQTGLKIIPNVGHGFGIDIDEDLQHPETKAIHEKIYIDVWDILEVDNK